MDTGILITSGWSTVWDIAGRRNDTKRGKNHLSDHAFEILQFNVQKEQQDIMNAAMSTMGLAVRRSSIM